MTETPEVLTEAELEGIQGGGLLLPAVQQVREAREGEKFFDEADTFFHQGNRKRIAASTGDGGI